MVSVIVPVYNVEPYLRRCVDSILSQTYPDIEVILVDDGSTDNSGFICDEYAQKDERIRVIHKENGGVSSARNAGRKASTGAYIAFIDSDDWIDPIYFEVLLQGLEQTNAHICVVEPLKCDDKSIESNFVKHGIQFVVLHGDSIIKAIPHNDRLRLSTSSALPFSVISHKNAREYAQYSLCFLFYLTKKCMAHLMHNHYAVLP